MRCLVASHAASALESVEENIIRLLELIPQHGVYKKFSGIVTGSELLQSEYSH